jgi:Uma2 family endonuclease
VIDGERFQIPPQLRLQLLALLAQDGEQGVAMAYDEFLDWADEDTLAEWVNGRVVMTSPASLRHQMLAQFLSRVLTGFVEVGQLGIVISAPFQMKLEQSGREPDVLFVAEAHRDHLRPTYLDGAADLVIEILSPESVGRDRGDKFYEYERARIPEYWLIDPETHRAEFYQLDGQKRYQLVPANADGIYHASALPGFWLKVAWLWLDPLPSVERTLLEIAGEPYARYLAEQLRQQGFTSEPDPDKS